MLKVSPQKTALYDAHVKAGAKMVDFAGWDMPIQYKGIKEEHNAVRTHAGLFDLSHMGEVTVKGPGHFEWLQNLITNDLSKIEDNGKALYTCMCNEQGKVLDDMIVYRFPDHLYVVVNASNREKIVNWMNAHKTGEVQVLDHSMKTSLIAIQGPKAQEILQRHCDLDLETIKYYSGKHGKVCGVEALVSRTGYTGEDGFELYLEWNDAPRVWEALVQEAPPIGLGARDTLRLESGYALYGHELKEELTPLDAGLGWVTKLDKPFIGRDALKQQKEAGLQRTSVGLVMEGRAIPREGYPVFHGEKRVGTVTSGTYSPTLAKGVALASVETAVRAEGTQLSVEIRGTRVAAIVTRPPFVKGSVRK